MQHQLIAVRILEERHVADPGVERVAVEGDPAALELLASLRDVWHAQGDVRGVRRRELLADVGRVDQVERDVLAELELRPAARGDLLKAERVPVKSRRPLHIRYGHRHEVGPFYDHRLSLPTRRPVISDGRTGKARRPEIGTASGASAINRPSPPSGTGSAGSSRPRTRAAAPS